MRVVVAHTQYRQRGGEDESVATEMELLSSGGHEVIPFLLSNADLDEGRPLHNAVVTIWNRGAARTLAELIRREQPDLLHVHNTFPSMSPSVVHAARRAGMPVVATLRNYRLTCANALLFRNGHPCTECVGRPLGWPGVKYRCYRDSRAASAVTVASTAAHRLLRTWSERVDRIIVLSDFARSLLVPSLGLDATRVVVKPNTVHPDPGPGPGGGRFAIYVGRLSPEKGLRTLLQAWQLLADPPALRIVGEGPLRTELERAAPPSVEVVGPRPHHEVLEMMGRAEMLVFPSEWFETFGRVGMEALARATPVIASDIGAVAEIVGASGAGRRFRMGDPADLARAVTTLAADVASRGSAIRAGARAVFDARFSPGANLRSLEAIYEESVDLRRRAPDQPR